MASATAAENEAAAKKSSEAQEEPKTAAESSPTPRLARTGSGSTAGMTPEQRKLHKAKKEKAAREAKSQVLPLCTCFHASLPLVCFFNMYSLEVCDQSCDNLNVPLCLFISPPRPKRRLRWRALRSLRIRTL